MKYWLKGLILGLLFGIFLTYIHENFGLFEGYPFLGFLVQKLHSFSFFSFLIFPNEYGTILTKIQYYVAPLVYSIYGLLIGITFDGIKNRKTLPFSKSIIKIVIILVIIACLIIAGKIYLHNSIYEFTPYVPQPTYGN